MTTINYAILPNVIITHLNSEYANTQRQEVLISVFVLNKFWTIVEASYIFSVIIEVMRKARNVSWKPSTHFQLSIDFPIKMLFVAFCKYLNELNVIITFC